MSVRRTNRFWSVSLEHILFLDFFETFCEHASRTKLRRKTKIVFFGPTDQKLWVFQVSRRSLGREGMCCSQPARVDHLHKKWRAGRKNISRKIGNCPTGTSVDPRLAGDHWSPAGPGPPTCGRGLVARKRPGLDRWLPVSWQPEVAVRRSVAQG
jgi:hypothetical protein